MPTVQELRSRLLKKLTELFQLDQPDLDFGFYRIMHAKAQEVQEFISTDLLRIVEEAFGDADEVRKRELEANIEKEIQSAKDYGVPDPENSPKVLEARVAYEAIKDNASAESDVYDHLYRFFERYYDAGDFVSRRYYTRETAGKAAPYAVPYNGEEVKLHWANADQYYIKSSEYFSNFTFDLRQAREVQELVKKKRAGGLFEDDDSPLKVHFKIVDAAEGEHGNIKTSDANKRFFILHAENPVALTETGELVVNFEYRPDPKKTGQENTWRDKRNAEAVETILERLENMAAASSEHEKQVAEYLRLLKVPAPTEKDKSRPVLAKYVNQYTARNTMDYFIHKDLGGFLLRELDFYIKNEVMRLDDIENADAPVVESYLAKIKVLRRIAGKLIDFLAQLEDFQKKLWLKKKFVVETNYCITLDRVPEELYPEVVANEAQCEEWINLFAIDEIQTSAGDLIDACIPGFSRPLTVEFLKANNKLVLDTRLFDESFKSRVLASIEKFDEQCDGLLIHSYNSHALSLIIERYRGQLKSIYIDPPYNTESNAILYKNTYKHSSWLTLMSPLLNQSREFEVTENGVHCIAIDSAEAHRLIELVGSIWPQKECTTVSVIHNPSGTMGKNFSGSGEYALFMHSSDRKVIAMENRDDNPDVRDLMNTAKGSSGNYLRQSGKNCFYPIFVKGKEIVGFGDICADDFHPIRNLVRDDGVIEVYPIDFDGVERKWVLARNTVELCKDELSTKVDRKTGEIRIERCKNRINYKTVWIEKKYSAKKYGTELVGDIVPVTRELPPLYPKSIHLVSDCIHASLNGVNDSPVLDYFAGSGTTGHAVISLNREDDGNRKYVLVEMGDHFDTVLKPRIAKVAYSENWKDGKPTARESGISHCFKYLRLESYEDALNNLRFDDNPQRQKSLAANSSLKEDYMLHYLLDVATRGSQS
ncbi:MAG: site-specific DNA-methyltransferase, partial [Prosthecochloris sp.]|uniref:DNA methyltransferase n=1 Tax=Prosthecochloris sp. TaxID=290513 RepID=UPI0013CAB863